MFKNPVRTSKRTPHFTITNINCLILFKEAGVAQGGLVSPVLFSLYVNDMPATSRSPLLLVSYLETYLNRLELWLRDCRIAINVSKCTASKDPGQSSFSESQYNGSTQHGTSG
jgi:hypothetical protein